MSLSGRAVPLALLPNGKMVDAIARIDNQTSEPETRVAVMARAAQPDTPTEPRGLFAKIVAFFRGQQ